MATPPSESIMCANVKTPVLDSLEPCLSNVRTNDDSGYFTPSPAVKSSSHTSIYTTTKQTFTCTPVKKTSLAIKDIPEKYGNNLGPPRIKESIVDSIPVRCANVNKTKQGLRSVQNFDRLKSKLQNVKTSPNLGSPSTTTTMSHDIGSWTKARHVDFIKEFSKLNLKIIISKIFNNLSDIDLSAVCCVSKTWQTICFSDTVSNLRRKNYIKRLRSNVQNVSI